MGIIIISTISGTFCPGGANMFITYTNISDAPPKIKAGNHFLNAIKTPVENRREKRNDKINLLKDLMAFRKNDHESHIQLARALNLIDVVFHDSKNVIHSYHDYRTALLARNDTKILNDLFVRLVQDISKVLEYDIDGFDIDQCVGQETLTYHSFQYPKSKLLKNE